MDMPILVWSVYMKGACYIVQTARIKTLWSSSQTMAINARSSPIWKRAIRAPDHGLRRCIIEGNLSCNRWSKRRNSAIPIQFRHIHKSMPIYEKKQTPSVLDSDINVIITGFLCLVCWISLLAKYQHDNYTSNWIFFDHQIFKHW